MAPRRENISFQHIEADPWLNDFAVVVDWLNQVALEEEHSIASLSYFFCSDDYLLNLNRQFLGHDTYTDIITFPDSYNPITAEIYISLERVFENAQIHAGGDKVIELHRVILHGLLHMCGYNDSSGEEKGIMRDREDHYLNKLQTS